MLMSLCKKDGKVTQKWESDYFCNIQEKKKKIHYYLRHWSLKEAVVSLLVIWMWCFLWDIDKKFCRKKPGTPSNHNIPKFFKFLVMIFTAVHFTVGNLSSFRLTRHAFIVTLSQRKAGRLCSWSWMASNTERMWPHLCDLSVDKCLFENSVLKD